jgi:hypothetical protein
MHSRDDDTIDAGRMVEAYIRFGEGQDAIPEFARPVIVAMVSEVLAIGRKQHCSDLATIADICSSPGEDSLRLQQIASLCQARLKKLTEDDSLSGDSAAPRQSGRWPARHATRRSQV